MEKGIKISPNFYQKDWTDLDLSKNNQNEWQKAIRIFKDRIEGRYFKQIETLDLNTDRTIGLYSGFAIMSLSCLLIETLEQFWNGNIENSRKNITGQNNKLPAGGILNGNNTIINDSLTFYNFFQRSHIFKQFFDNEEKANIFYVKIRCGLLHQGQTKGKSLIHVRKNESVLKWIDDDNKNLGISIHRRLFVKEIRGIYNNYISELEKPHNLNFRKKTFKKKMDYIVNLN